MQSKKASAVRCKIFISKYDCVDFRGLRCLPHAAVCAGTAEHKAALAGVHPAQTAKKIEDANKAEEFPPFFLRWKALAVANAEHA